MNFEDSKDPKLKEKLRNVSSPEELLELAKKEGFDLSDEQLEGVSGGDSLGLLGHQGVHGRLR